MKMERGSGADDRLACSVGREGCVQSKFSSSCSRERKVQQSCCAPTEWRRRQKRRLPSHRSASDGAQKNTRCRRHTRPCAFTRMCFSSCREPTRRPSDLRTLKRTFCDRQQLACMYGLKDALSRFGFILRVSRDRDRVCREDFT